MWDKCIKNIKVHSRLCMFLVIALGTSITNEFSKNDLAIQNLSEQCGKKLAGRTF